MVTALDLGSLGFQIRDFGICDLGILAFGLIFILEVGHWLGRLDVRLLEVWILDLLEFGTFPNVGFALRVLTGSCKNVGGEWREIPRRSQVVVRAPAERARARSGARGALRDGARGPRGPWGPKS